MGTECGHSLDSPPPPVFDGRMAWELAANLALVALSPFIVLAGAVMARR